MLAGRRRLFEGPLSFFPLCLFLQTTGNGKGGNTIGTAEHLLSLAGDRRRRRMEHQRGMNGRADAGAGGSRGNRAHAREHGPPFGRPPPDLPTSVRSDERVVPRQKEKEGRPKEMLSTARFDLTLDFSIRIDLSLSSAPRTRSASN